LKKEHANVREETVKAILEDQKLSQEIKKVENDAKIINEVRTSSKYRALQSSSHSGVYGPVDIHKGWDSKLLSPAVKGFY
jgi:hypothetical protein